MKKILLAIGLSTLFVLSASAQEDTSTRTLSQLKGDYGQVRIVARVKIREIKFAAASIHTLYVVRGEVLETFKGRLKRGQELEFYFDAEEDYDVSKRPRELIIFLEGRHPVPGGGKGWYEMENSSVIPTETNLARMRRIRGTRKRG